MPTAPCDFISRPIAQTLFLGSSVASFNSSVGWGGQPSQLTVNLIDDTLVYSCGNPSGVMYTQFAGTTNNANHFYTCDGIQCYMDRYSGAVATAGSRSQPQAFRKQFPR